VAVQLAVYFFERALAASGRHRQFSTDPKETIGKPYTDEIREAYAYNQMALAYKARPLSSRPKAKHVKVSEDTHAPNAISLTS
jgi:hypothetical protein